MTTLEEILQNWKDDAQIDSSELAAEAANTPVLHHKYYKIFVEEKLKLRYLQSQFKKLKLAKYEHYIQGPSKETISKGWEVPAIGKVLKQDVQLYLDADKELSEFQLKIDYAQEKIDALSAIITQINGRSYLIGHCISDTRWKGGA